MGWGAPNKPLVGAANRSCSKLPLLMWLSGAVAIRLQVLIVKVTLEVPGDPNVNRTIDLKKQPI